jgi:hypothetical protein
LKEKANKAHIDIFFTNGTDIESHFLDAQHIKKIYTDIDTVTIEALISEATENTKEKSIKNYINAKTKTALKEQYAGGEKVDSGQIAIQCLSYYENDKKRFRHGKQVFKFLRNKLQAEYGQKNLIVPTENLKTTELTEIKSKIWTI